MPTIGARYNASGPILRVHIGVNRPLATRMRAQGRTIPSLVPLQLIVDTGADTTLLAEQWLRGTLGMRPSGARDLLTATSSAGSTECPTYGVELQIVPSSGDDPFVIPALEVMAQNLFNLSVDGMLGRDVLDRLTLVVEGRSRHFRIDY